MKKEKTVRTHQRRTKSGKVVTVHEHTAKYDAAEKLKEAAKKKGAGDELEKLGKRLEKSYEKEHKKSDTSYGFTADEYKAWYHWDQDADTKNKSALKVEKALKKQMGTKAYNKYFDEMSDSYSSRGHNKAFKGLSETLSIGEKKSVTPFKETKDSKKRNQGSKKTLSWQRDAEVQDEKDLANKRRAEATSAKDVMGWAKANKYHLKKNGLYAKGLGKGTHSVDDLRNLMRSSKSKEGLKDPKSPKTSTKKVRQVMSSPTDFKAFLKVSTPAKGSKGYAAHMALRSVARNRGFADDDSVRNALVRNGYPKDKAYTQGIKEVLALAKKHNLRW